MSTSSGREGSCERCGHPLNEHARKSESKCKGCKRHFEICQQIHLGGSGYRLCYIPCTCGKENYPDKAKVATPLEPYEYLLNHPGYRPREYSDDDEEESKLDVSLHSSPTHVAASHEPQGVALHTRNISQESEDPLQWSEAKYTQNTTMPYLIEAFATTSISAAASANAKDKGPEDTSQWCEWEWHDEYQCEYRSRQRDGKWEYDYRESSSLVPATAPAKSVPTTKTTAKSSKSVPSKSVPSKSSVSKSSKSSTSKSSKSSSTTDWNKWEWSKEYKCEYRSRQKEDGEWEYEYRPKGE
jgi:hypothetical protein